MKTCDKPDRDEPRLKCGYPFPCPHHTVIIEDDEATKVALALANLRWLSGRVLISTTFLIAPCTIKDGEDRPVGGSVVRIVTRCVWARDRSGVGSAPLHQNKEYVAELPLHATPTEIRNAAEEHHIEARAWLEEHYSTPAFLATSTDVEEASEAALVSARAQGIAALGDVALGYIPECRRPIHRDGKACDGGCSEIADPAERRAAGLDLDARRPKAPRRRRRR